MLLTQPLRLLLIPMMTVILFGGCAKTEGEGGAATIKGRVMVQDYNLSHNPNGDPYPGYDIKVYIIYGNGTTYHDDFDCSYDGTYEFRNLRKGNYKVFVYTDIVPEPSDPPKQDVIIQQVSITDKKGVYTVPDIQIKQY